MISLLVTEKLVREMVQSPLISVPSFQLNEISSASKGTFTVADNFLPKVQKSAYQCLGFASEQI
uniref:Uncharacterized protein n=1 Tax=Arion vulgaris TaxID=1028688 RepID=A0A0B7A8H4_9EUPU